MSMSDERPDCVIGADELDRRAYESLLRQSIGRPTISSDVSEDEVAAAGLASPCLFIVLAEPHARAARAAADHARRLCPATPVLVVSAMDTPADARLWCQCPVNGFVARDAELDELRAAIDEVRAGRTYISREISERLTRAVERARHPALSRREAELLPLLATGLTLHQAAERMSVGYKTADSHRSRLLRKLGIHDRVALTRYAIREGIIDA